VPTWDEFKSIIRDAFTLNDTVDSVDHIIATLETKVKYGVGLTPDARRLLRPFQQVVEGNMTKYKMRMHCEAVFAALLVARNRAQSPSVDTETQALANFYMVLGLVCLDVKCFIHIFPVLAGRYDFGVEIVLPRLLGALQSSWLKDPNSRLSSQHNPTCVARHISPCYS
jgi:hypothetical protein